MIWRSKEGKGGAVRGWEEDVSGPASHFKTGFFVILNEGSQLTEKMRFFAALRMTTL
jgi:hypothetical protein